MDLLPLPQDLTFPTPTTSYLCHDETWDLGPFLTYLDRRYQDLGLEELPPPLPDQGQLSLSLQRIFESAAVDRLEPFVQAWLYFGLVAEFLALNELADGSRLVPLAEARVEMAALHRELCLDEAEADAGNRDENDGTGQLLTGKPILSKTSLFAERLLRCADLSPPLLQSRYSYLHACLTRTILIINNTGDRLRHSIRYSIAALGELFTTSLYASTHLMTTTPRVTLPASGFNWYRDYLRPGSDAERHMLSFGWCPSAVEKLRLLFQGVASLHYVSRLRQQHVQLSANHANCTNYACTAFQIDMASYQPHHVRDGCRCENVEIDEAALLRILHGTASFPVLTIRTGSDADSGPSSDAVAVTVTMETYEPGMPYVALSHVWADGLGNPVCNALPGCQLARVARSVAQLHSEQNGSEAARQPICRVWIDTICCPIEPRGKAIALERITDVYKNATYVLVLDSSLTCLDTTTCHPAELLLRTFSCSPWMRRLWTLQEAILAKSLCVQFQDRAVSSNDLMRDLYLAGINDSRFLRIWQDLLNEFTLLQSFETAGSSLRDTFQHPQLVMLQRALHFRTVSVASDEPLCIATLMGLTIPGLTTMTDGQQRMVRVWSALVEQLGGSIASALVYFLEDTLSIPGWRWAPKSLLGSLGRVSTLGLDERSLRFAIPKPVAPSAVGVPTARGLRIQAMGALLAIHPLRQHLGVRPWDDVTAKRRAEAHIAILRESTGEWFRAAEWHRSRMLGLWTEQERRAHDDEHASPLLDSVCTNEAALVFRDFERSADVTVAILGQATGGEEHGYALRREHTVMFWRMRDSEVRLLRKARRIAERLADDEVATALAGCAGSSTTTVTGRQRDVCAARAREWLEKEVAREWDADAEFAELVREVLGSDTDASSAWPLVIAECSNVITMRETVSDQVWFID